MIRERRIKMQLYCEGRVDSANYELLREMKRAGFNVIYFGTESASQHVLDYYQKRITPEESVNAIANAKKLGMLVVTSYIIGAPAESKDDIMNTITMIKKTRPHGVQINILDCLVGTQIWKDLEQSKIVGREDWKTNHRIYEYLKEGLSKEELEGLAVQGYSAHVQGWKSKGGMLDIARLIIHNKSARKILLGNFANPDARRMVLEELGAEQAKPPMERKSEASVAQD
jgi:radical SAM superfamily enzyme YgiQ (UPF0313 family)